MDLRLFFSWQEDSDSRKLEQKKFIKQCIEEAIARVNKELRYVNIIFQEGVRGVSGSPELIPEIEERIKQCHIFIGDYTFINQENFLSKFIKKCFMLSIRSLLILMSLMRHLVLPQDLICNIKDFKS